MQIPGGKFVVTGGASLIGSHVAEQLLSQGAREVVLLDNYALGSPDTVKSLLGDPRIKLVRGDILRINELYDAFEGCDGVFAIAGFLTLPLSQNPSLGLAVGRSTSSRRAAIATSRRWCFRRRSPCTAIRHPA
jgi:UDP-glucose 4-epimerase